MSERRKSLEHRRPRKLRCFSEREVSLKPAKPEEINKRHFPTPAFASIIMKISKEYPHDGYLDCALELTLPLAEYRDVYDLAP